MSILLLGQSGYIGSAFMAEMARRKIPTLSPFRNYLDYTDADRFRHMLALYQPKLVINCAAFIPKPSVALCDQSPSETIKGNLAFPMMLSLVCGNLDIPLAHISTGCLWSDGKEHSEEDPPQREFTGHCGFYVGVKILAERMIDQRRNYIWRVRLPFDSLGHERNYLSKLAGYEQVFDQTNSVSHRGDFVKACLDLWKMRAPFGIYNVMNQGALATSEIVRRMAQHGLIKSPPRMLADKTGECRLSVSKLLKTGVSIRSAEDALAESIKNWTPCI